MTAGLPKLAVKAFGDLCLKAFCLQTLTPPPAHFFALPAKGTPYFGEKSKIKKLGRPHHIAHPFSDNKTRLCLDKTIFCPVV